jgi:hypothetical protein
MLAIIEKHFQLVDELDRQPGFDRAAARAFLLQTLAPLNVAVHGFLDRTKRYEEQRARADDDLADRDAFRNAVVNPTAGPIRGWSTRRRRGNNSPGSVRKTRSSTTPRCGIVAAAWCGWQRTSTTSTPMPPTATYTWERFATSPLSVPSRRARVLYCG